MISVAIANETATATSQGSPLVSFAMLGVLLVFFYFFVWRPQSKRAKEQKTLLENLKIEDNVLTTAGIVGKIEKMEEQFVMLKIAENTTIKMQKAQVVAVLPRE